MATTAKIAKDLKLKEHKQKKTPIQGVRHRNRCFRWRTPRSEEHTSELQSRFGISYAVFCLKETATTEIYTLSLHDALPI